MGDTPSEDSSVRCRLLRESDPCSRGPPEPCTERYDGHCQRLSRAGARELQSGFPDGAGDGAAGGRRPCSSWTRLLTCPLLSPQLLFLVLRFLPGPVLPQSLGHTSCDAETGTHSANLHATGAQLQFVDKVVDVLVVQVVDVWFRPVLGQGRCHARCVLLFDVCCMLLCCCCVDSDTPRSPRAFFAVSARGLKKWALKSTEDERDKCRKMRQKNPSSPPPRHKHRHRNSVHPNPGTSLHDHRDVHNPTCRCTTTGMLHLVQELQTAGTSTVFARILTRTPLCTAGHPASSPSKHVPDALASTKKLIHDFSVICDTDTTRSAPLREQLNDLNEEPMDCGTGAPRSAPQRAEHHDQHHRQTCNTTISSTGKSGINSAMNSMICGTAHGRCTITSTSATLSKNRTKTHKKHGDLPSAPRRT